jgi:hypothetical protein
MKNNNFLKSLIDGNYNKNGTRYNCGMLDYKKPYVQNLLPNKL